LELSEITGFVKRRFVPGVVTFVIVLAASIGFSFIVTPEYESDCMLTISSGSEMGLLGGMGALQELTTFSKTGTPLDTQIELIRLTPRLQECIDEFDLRDKKGEPLKPEDFLETIDVLLYENTDIIQVKAHDKSPELARDFAQFLADNHLRVEAEKDRQTAADAYRMFEQKVLALKSDIDVVDLEMAAFMDREGAIDVETEARVAIEGLGDLDREYYSRRAQLAGIRSRRIELEKQLTESLPTIISETTIQQNPEIRSLQNSLNSAEIKLAGQLTRYTENHPDVINTKEQIGSLRARIAELAPEVVASEVESLNPIHQELLREYAVNMAAEEGLVSQLVIIRSDLDEKQKSLEGFADKEIEYMSLVRRQKVLEILYGEAKARLELLPVYTDVSDTSIAGKIIKMAEVPEKPVKPNKLLNAIAGFVIGLLMAFLVALWLEFTDQSLRGPGEITRKFGLKHLGGLTRASGGGEFEMVYGSIMAGLKLTGDADHTVGFLCFGRAGLGFDVIGRLAKQGASTAPLNLVVLDNESEIIDGLLPDSGSGGLASALNSGKVKPDKHPAGYNILGGTAPYPVDMLLGDGFADFLKSLEAGGERSFVIAPVASHAPGATIVCAACDGTVFIVDSSRTTPGMVKQAAGEIEAAGGRIVGFVDIA